MAASAKTRSCLHTAVLLSGKLIGGEARAPSCKRINKGIVYLSLDDAYVLHAVIIKHCRGSQVMETLCTSVNGNDGHDKGFSQQNF